MMMGHTLVVTADLVWLEKLLETTFFDGCLLHGRTKKNLFCIHCCASLCPQCKLKHTSHNLLQIRRYMYQDVVQLEDIKSLIDCSHVQRYSVNSSEALYLNRNARSGPIRHMDNFCRTCRRSLLKSYHFCSLACKVKAMLGELVQQAKDTCTPNDSSSAASSKVTEVSDTQDTCSPMQKSTHRRKGIPRRSALF